MTQLMTTAGRLRRRFEPLGLAIRTVRQRGSFVEALSP
jgi:hypothetical protein